MSMTMLRLVWGLVALLLVSLLASAAGRALRVPRRPMSLAMDGALAAAPFILLNVLVNV
jgi:hypothetical protein